MGNILPLIGNLHVTVRSTIRVHDLPGDLSGHCPVSFGIAVSVSHEVSHTKASTQPRTFKWHEGAESLIKTVLAADPNLQQLLQNEVSNIDTDVQSLNDLLTQTASKCLVTVGRRKAVKNKKWFNHSCSVLRQEVKKLSKSLSKNPHSIATREAFNNTKRRYKKQLKKARQEFKNKISHALDTSLDNNPKLYWKLLDQLKRIDDIGEKMTATLSQAASELNTIRNYFANKTPVLEINRSLKN